jgi:threonine dehydrogenase-like Zn-dependent dehydrogenase
MRATLIHGAGDVRVAEVPDPIIKHPTDALLRVVVAYSDGTCAFCQEGLQTSCVHGGFWANGDVDGGQGEAVRVPLADGTLVKLPVGEDSALLPSLLTLSDVYGTGWHAAVRAGVKPGMSVTVPNGYRAMADRDALKVLVRP